MGVITGCKEEEQTGDVLLEQAGCTDEEDDEKNAEANEEENKKEKIEEPKQPRSKLKKAKAIMHRIKLKQYFTKKLRKRLETDEGTGCTPDY